MSRQIFLGSLEPLLMIGKKKKKKKEREGGRNWERGGRIKDFHLRLLFQILVLLFHTDSLPLFFSGSFPDQKEAVTCRLNGLCQHLSSAPSLRLGLLFFPPSSSQSIHTQLEEKATGWVLSHVGLGLVVPGRSPDTPESLLHLKSEDELVFLMGHWEELMK